MSLMDLLRVYILMMGFLFALSLFWLFPGRYIDFATEPAAKYPPDTPELLREQSKLSDALLSSLAYLIFDNEICLGVLESFMLISTLNALDSNQVSADQAHICWPLSPQQY